MGLIKQCSHSKQQMPESTGPFSELLDFFARTQLFQGLPREQLAALLQLARSQTYGKGEVVFRQEDPCNGFFLIRSGRIKIFQLGANGREQILHIFAAGGHFAEVPAFDGKCYPASATALEATEVLFFPSQSFLALLEQNPDLAINLLKSFARHLRRFSNLVDSLSLKDVPGRLAVYLLNLSDREAGLSPVNLDLSKGQLAAMLGTIPETLSRALLKLSKEGVIEVEGSRITLLDLNTLRKLAE